MQIGQKWSFNHPFQLTGAFLLIFLSDTVKDKSKYQKMNDTELSKLLDDALSDLLAGSSNDITGSNDSNNENNNSEKDHETIHNEVNDFFEKLNDKFQKGEFPELDPNESVPQIFDMMQNLLSKELLLPALTDLLPKFKDWLKENSQTLSKADKKRYDKQCSLISEMIQVFDDQTLDDKEKFHRNIGLMETMQSLGSPPDELIVPNDGLARGCSMM